jgi:IS5 family transposase
MRKDNINAKLTDFEIKRNKAISKYRYIVEQYFGISHLHDKGNKARFPTMIKNTIDIMFRQFAFSLRVTFRLKKGAKILEVLPV